MQLKRTYKLSREDLKNKDFKNYETKLTGVASSTRNNEALSELLKAVKKLK